MFPCKILKDFEVYFCDWGQIPCQSHKCVNMQSACSFFVCLWENISPYSQASLELMILLSRYWVSECLNKSQLVRWWWSWCKADCLAVVDRDTHTDHNAPGPLPAWCVFPYCCLSVVVWMRMSPAPLVDFIWSGSLLKNQHLLVSPP